MAELKPELSHKNKYWLPRHRYYELRHFCLQYPEWKRLYLELDFQTVKFPGGVFSEKRLNRPVENLATVRTELKKNMELVERVCKETDSSLSYYIFLSVTEGKSYNTLKMVHGIPCGPDMFYDRFRRFYWLLSQER